MKRIIAFGVTAMILILSLSSLVPASNINQSIKSPDEIYEDLNSNSFMQEEYVSILCRFMICGDGSIEVNKELLVTEGCHRLSFAKVQIWGENICCIAACSLFRNPAWNWCCKNPECNPPISGDVLVRWFIGSICVLPGHMNPPSFTMCGFAFIVNYNGSCPP